MRSLVNGAWNCGAWWGAARCAQGERESCTMVGSLARVLSLCTELALLL